MRAIEPEDLDTLYEIENDRDIWDCGTTNVPYSRYVLHKYVSNAVCDIYADKEVRMILCNGENETIGIVDLVNFDPRHQRAEVGIVLRKAYRKQGYASSALDHLKRYSANILHLHQLYAIVDSNNVSSVELFQRGGFQRNAVLKDWLVDRNGYCDAYIFEYFF